ncbi:unnamed protein product [Ilex paraguariensis]|uniref:Uncharacterized protein n=1 Tax=Ilex paraguariensis TaxID=185542 RepID=A0ABC8TPP0_9AQUA
MAATDPQKQILTLIRDFATEKSQGERRIVYLKKRIQELRAEVDAANAELECAKRLKETTEQEIKGYEVELSMNKASIQALEARISLIQDEISAVGSDLEAVKNEEGALRDDFIEKMRELNATIRKFQETVVCAFHEENLSGSISTDGAQPSNTRDTEVARRAIEDQLQQIISQTNIQEQEYQAEQNTHKQVQQELIDLERKLSLMEAIMKESMELQELTRYPYLILLQLHDRLL